jgi:nucleotide-binding universal stress UspA family protein
VPIDGSAASTAGLNEAIRIAKSQGSRIRLVHIVNDVILENGYGSGVYATDALEVLRREGQGILDAAQALAQREGVKAESLLLESVAESAADLIIAQAKNWTPDLIVMGTHGRRGLARLVMGSDAESVVRSTTIPVLLVRGTLSRSAPSRSTVKASAA